MKESKKVTIQQLREAYTLMLVDKDSYEEASKDYQESSRKFAQLRNRASAITVKKFYIENNL